MVPRSMVLCAAASLLLLVAVACSPAAEPVVGERRAGTGSEEAASGGPGGRQGPEVAGATGVRRPERGGATAPATPPRLPRLRRTTPPPLPTSTPQPSQTADEPDPSPETLPSSAPEPGPPETLLPEIRIDLPPAAEDGDTAMATTLRTPGVTFATLVAVAGTAVSLPGGGRAEIQLAAVDPAGFRVMVPQITADSSALWQRVAEGELTLTHDQAAALEVGLDDVLDTAGGPLRVAAIADLGLPPVAHGMVDRSLAGALGIAEPRTLLVAVEPTAWPDEVAAALEAALDVEATLIYGKPQRELAELPRSTVWDQLAVCESSGNWAANTGNGYYGGLQFLPSSWHLVGGTGLPHEASRDEQILRAELLLQRQGWRAWPVCSVRLGLRQPGPGDAPDGRPLRPPARPDS